MFNTIFKYSIIGVLLETLSSWLVNFTFPQDTIVGFFGWLIKSVYFFDWLFSPTALFAVVGIIFVLEGLKLVFDLLAFIAKFVSPVY